MRTGGTWAAALIGAAALLAAPAPAAAQRPATHGGPELTGRVSRPVWVGWPSIGYQWRRADWAWTGEIVYGEWSGAFVDVDAAAAVGFELRRIFGRRGRFEVGGSLAPAVLLGEGDGQPALLASARVERRVSVISGVASPVTLIVSEGTKVLLVPVYPRLGLEVAVSNDTTLFLLVEAGPGFRLFDDAGTGMGARVSVGLTM